MDLSKYKVESKDVFKEENTENNFKQTGRKKLGRKPADEPLKKLVSCLFYRSRI